MKEAHQGMGITDEQFDALAMHLKDAMQKNNVAPDDVVAVLGAIGATRADIVEGARKDEPKKIEDKPLFPPDPKKSDDKPLIPPILDPKKGDEKPLIPPILDPKKGDEKPLFPPIPDPKKIDEKPLFPPIPDPTKKGDENPLIPPILDPSKKADEKPLFPPIPDPTKKAPPILDSKPLLPPFKSGEERQESRPDPNLARGSGKVTIGGQPLTHGYVEFIGPTGKSYEANISKTGTFVFRKGFPAGEYTVLLRDGPARPEPNESRLTIPVGCTDPVLTPLRFTATKGENNFELVVK